MTKLVRQLGSSFFPLPPVGATINLSPINRRKSVMRSRSLLALWSLVLSILCAGFALAQTTNGNLRGTVTDQNGAVLPNAIVVVKNRGTNAERRVTTNSEGNYAVDNLTPGEYEIRVEAQGFQKQLKP